MARGYIPQYRTYAFKDKDPIIDKMRTVIADSGNSYSHISELSGVSTTTLYNWFSGPTRKPQFASSNAVLRAIGKKLVIVDITFKENSK
jgi:DNA-binding phage protein